MGACARVALSTRAIARAFWICCRSGLLYESVARAVIPARDDLIEHALPAAARLAAAHVPSSARMIWAGTASGGHPVFVGDGVLDAATSLLPVDTRLVVADENVLDLHGERLGAALIDRVMPEQMLVVPSGERYKTLAEAERVLQSLARSGMERADTLLVFGGGVVGDVAGFAPLSTSAEWPSFRSRPPSWRRSIPPTAARPGWTYRSEELRARSISRAPC